MHSQGFCQVVVVIYFKHYPGIFLKGPRPKNESELPDVADEVCISGHPVNSFTNRSLFLLPKGFAINYPP